MTLKEFFEYAWKHFPVRDADKPARWYYQDYLNWKFNQSIKNG